MTLDKIFDHKKAAKDFYAQQGPTFKMGLQKDAPNFALMMPPPNVTGSLHLGHALTYTLQDILSRYHRSLGFNTLYQPGTDHAGIATQMVVEKQLAEKGQTRHDLGREKFIQRVWEWKEESGNTIVSQQRELMISPDWSRARFTMDEGLSTAVRQVFVTLYKQGLIYRDKRLVNWDTALQTALSDIEVVSKDATSHIWHIRYTCVNDPAQSIVVATTRPETLFGDQAVAVHPEDARYQHLIGQMVSLPLTGRTIPVIADEYCAMDMGTGAVKITPAHDFNDFEVGKRHGLERLNIMNDDGTLNACVPEKLQGLSMEQARKLVLQDLEEQGLLIETELRKNTKPYSERSDVEVQPYLTDQWYVDAPKLAGPALEAVEKGDMVFYPKHWENTYFEWLRNIQPWCISRQIWWGHQVPVWYGPDGTVFVEETEEEARIKAKAHYGKEENLRRDTDVLDTWFSSALWPFTTLGWPEKTEELERYYPTTTLVTGFDIIFFWVARMMMMGLHFMGKIPFKNVYIHALVRDEKGQKMSKSKGNIIDPLHLIETYGADALRYTLAALSVPGRDVKLSEARVEMSRNFITKIWNAARFLEMNGCVYMQAFDPKNVEYPLNQWILSQLSTSMRDLDEHLKLFRFDLAAQTLYHFFWTTFCDVYVEAVKPLFVLENDVAQETRQTAAWVFVTFMERLHPFMPLITDYLYQHFTKSEGSLSARTQTVLPDFSFSTQSIDWCVELTQRLRSLRGLLNVTPGLRLNLYFMGKESAYTCLSQNFSWISSLVRLQNLERIETEQMGNQWVSMPFEGDRFFLDLGQGVDVEEVLRILSKKAQKLDEDIKRLEIKIQNETYKSNKPDLWEEDVESLEIKQQDFAQLQNILSMIQK